MILDTNVIIRLMQGGTSAVRTLERLEAQRVELTVSAVTVYELYHSLERIDNPVERHRHIQAVLDSKPVRPADSTVMKKAGRIDGRLTPSGNAIGMADTIIAATALVTEEPVLTENVEHFDRIDGLSVESY